MVLSAKKGCKHFLRLHWSIRLPGCAFFILVCLHPFSWLKPEETFKLTHIRRRLSALLFPLFILFRTFISRLLAARTSLHAGPVIFLPAFLISKTLICLLNFIHALCLIRIILNYIRMIKFCQFSICSLYILFRGLFRYPEYPVIIFHFNPLSVLQEQSFYRKRAAQANRQPFDNGPRSCSRNSCGYLCAVSAFHSNLRHFILFLFDYQRKGSHAFRVAIILLIVHYKGIGICIFADYL